MNNFRPTEAQIRRIAELGGTLEFGATRADAKKVIARRLPKRPPTDGTLRFFVDCGGIPFDGLTMVEAERLTDKLINRPAATIAKLQQLYGQTPAHPYLLEWLGSFGYVLNGEILSGEVSKVIQTTKNEVDYLNGNVEDEKNPVEVIMRKLRRCSFPEWAFRKREMIDKHLRLSAARKSAGVSRHSEASANLGEIAKTLEWERMVFWLAFTGVDMCPHESDWELGYDFADIPALATKLAKTVSPMKPATEAEVIALLIALDAEQLDWELGNPAQAFVAIRQKRW